MRKILLSLSVALFSLTASAQTTATFESLTLPKADTAYVNYSAPGTDVGFNNGLVHFPCVYDTSGGYNYWSSGFAYSNRIDTATSGFMNQYSAKTGKGFAASDKYAVAYGTYNKVQLTGAAIGQTVLGFYVTNNTYAYNSMRDGDSYAKKFTGAAKDFFRLDVFAYRKDTLGKDSVSFYLADFRNADSADNYIVNDWQWVDLLKLGKVDSLMFRLQSSDNGTFGMNTPAYFCIDNFITNETGVEIKSVVKSDLKIYPNSATNKVFVESNVTATQQVLVTDMSGKTMAQYEINQGKLEINIANYASGTYIITFRNGEQVSYSRFVKQ